MTSQAVIGRETETSRNVERPAGPHLFAEIETDGPAGIGDPAR